jgi:hypothetical protein
VTFDKGEAVRHLKKVWDEAEDKLKRTERMKGNLTIPAVNELRYAGFHLLKALNVEDETVSEDNFKRAEKHCKRAGYDSVEAEVLFHSSTLRQFKEDYRMVKIEVSGLDYVGIRHRANTTMALVHEARKDEETREQYYERLVGHCDTLREDVERLDAARDELNKIVVQGESDQLGRIDDRQRDKRKTRITLVVAIALAVVGWAVAWFKPSHDASATPTPKITAPKP